MTFPSFLPTDGLLNCECVSETMTGQAIEDVLHLKTQ